VESHSSLLSLKGLFFLSLIQLLRVIEEQAKGDPNKSHEIRQTFDKEIGESLSNIKPGSEQANLLKSSFLKRNMWSQYLEVGLMKDVEVFTKAQPLSSVGFGAKIGILRTSTWNNPEPEIVLLVDAEGNIVGCTLGNDVNLRDYEGRSALLLGKAKDNNASCALGPFIRLLDDSFNLDDIRQAEVSLTISGKQDGFHTTGTSSMKSISRDILDLVSQTRSKDHQYPDGFALFTGTMFAPTMDRDSKGKGFTHKVGDVVTIQNSKLGGLVNTVHYCDEIEPWSYGLLEFYKYLSKRKL
jgi:fumarylacetoacetate (FAA) hydrolase family protein